MPITFRPLDDATWPGEFTPDDARARSQFSTSTDVALWHLQHEVDLTVGDDDADAVLEVPYPSNRIYRGGTGVHRDAAAPRHPGVALSLTVPDAGPLRFACDRYRSQQWGTYLPHWLANVRAITLTLAALRAVDRHGAVRKAEQYRGWAAIGSGDATPLGAGGLTREEAARILADAAGADAAGLGAAVLLLDPVAAGKAYRLAARRYHPDTGTEANGDAFALVARAAEALR